MPASDILLTIQKDTKEEEKEIIQQFLLRLQYSMPLLNQSERPDFEMQFGENLKRKLAAVNSDYDFCRWHGAA
jgi:hypothetical protein